ncbi:DinB family protein [Paenibacillus alkalitolerans]|uniref:DinB family protein n=1 Tax=Paenibacillus alkalitolerans TaxID=2799335 RepID=UPI0018F37389|nr:DinB family protein [Paenibacillus alkalitolerans]
MAMNNEDMVKEFEAFIPFVVALNDYDESHWNLPIAEGKWSLKDIICHIMLWDKYFYEEAILKIKLKEPLTVRHLNFDEFNANAIEYSKSQTKQSIIDRFAEYRSKIINDISGLSDEEYIQEYFDGDKKIFTIQEYLRGFIPHDKQHKEQIEKFLKSIA